jgi:ubiquinone/menaquinone biosynthesis C-methylase UbiE
MKAIAEAIFREAEPVNDMDVLDYGCGTGLIGSLLLPHVGSVTRADNSTGMLEVLRGKILADGWENMEAMQLDLEQDSVPNTRYHIITVGMAMHRIADTDRVLRAFHEMLTPGGTLCLAELVTEPGTFHPAEMADIVHHHGFNRDQLKQPLAETGFAEMKDITALAFNKPVEGQGEREFSGSLICARRP